MKILYTTPNGEYSIGEGLDYDAWDLYKINQKQYFIVKKDITRKDIKITYVVHYVKKLETAFRWLRWNKIISSDEMRYQISKLTSE